MFTWLSLLTSLPSLFSKIIDAVYDAIRGYKVSTKRNAAEKWEIKQNENADKRIQEILDKQSNKDSTL